jgi:hypothetical protein
MFHLRRRPSLPFATQSGNPIEAHHIRTAANSGMGMKPDDKYARAASSTTESTTTTDGAPSSGNTAWTC